MEKNFESYQQDEAVEAEIAAEATADVEEIVESEEFEEIDLGADNDYADDLFDDDSQADFEGVDENTAVLLDKLEELWHAGVLTEDEYLEKVNLLLNGSATVDYEKITLKVVAGAALVTSAVLATALIITKKNAKKQETRSAAVIRRLTEAKGEFGDAIGRFAESGRRFFK